MGNEDGNGKNIFTKTNLIRLLAAIVLVLASFGFRAIMAQISDIDDAVEKMGTSIDEKFDGVNLKIGVIGNKVDSLKDVIYNANITDNNLTNRIERCEEKIGEIKDVLR